MEQLLKLQQKIVPELLELLEKRYNILRTIYYNQPIGRRVLANNLGIGERIVRTEINFLKSQNFIEINTQGMTITREGEIINDKLKDFIHEMKGLSDIESQIKEKLKLRDIIVVPGSLDEDHTVMNELGRTAASYLRGIIKDNSIISLTGGSTIKEVVDNMPGISGLENIFVVPARGGMGKNIQTQANTLVSNLASKLSANYRLLHVPDNLSDKALGTIVEEKDIREILDIIHSSNILIYGIGRADQMARKRGLSEDKVKKIYKAGGVGEAFGYYFNRFGEVVYSTPTIGIKNDDINKIDFLVAIAGGKEKAEAIISTEINNSNSVLVTDEGAACEILNIINSQK